MELVRVQVGREWRDGEIANPVSQQISASRANVRANHEEIHASGMLIIGDVRDHMPALLREYEGKIKLIYLDPPYLTGEKFSMRVRVGEGEWKSAKGTLELPAFNDTKDREAYIMMMRRVLADSHKLLREDGMLFLHIDYRAHPYMRLLLDEIFGESNFLNEIIWVYQSGGRSTKYFSRKHDVILFYRKSAKYDFNLEEVMTAPNSPRSNHMRRHVDPDGRVYRSIRSNGRIYTYYDDDPVAPSDVWNDLSHLQQRDPERTGYDTQKPLALLDRIVKCASRPGELVFDPFAGSATTLEAAMRNGREFIGVEKCPLAMNIARRRLFGGEFETVFEPFEGNPVCRASIAPGVGFYQITLEEFALEPGICPREFKGLDAVDNWSVGYLREDGYHCMVDSVRRRRKPGLETTLAAPVYDGTLAMCVADVLGRSFYYRIVQS